MQIHIQQQKIQHYYEQLLLNDTMKPDLNQVQQNFLPVLHYLKLESIQIAILKIIQVYVNLI